MFQNLTAIFSKNREKLWQSTLVFPSLWKF